MNISLWEKVYIKYDILNFMPYYIEGILWYLILLDSIVYNLLCWTKGKWHDKMTHWISAYFPFNKFVGLLYLIMTIWVGFALYRLQIILFI